MFQFHEKALYSKCFYENFYYSMITKSEDELSLHRKFRVQHYVIRRLEYEMKTPCFHEKYRIQAEDFVFVMLKIFDLKIENQHLLTHFLSFNSLFKLRCQRSKEVFSVLWLCQK